MTTSTPYSDGVTDDAGEAGTDTSSTPDMGKTFDLSDAAAGVLYPDVPSGPPPEVTPDMLEVPPPFEQRESALLDIIRMYGSGQTDWPTALKALGEFPYAAEPERAAAPTGPTAGQWYGEVEADIGAPAADNTWQQLMDATEAGMLTRDERNQVLQAVIANRQAAAEPTAKPGDQAAQE